MKANTKKAKLLSLVLAILTALSTVTVLPFSVFAEDAVTSLTITPNYGKIENYGTPKQTFFILTMRSAKGDDDSQALYNKVRDWQATMNMTITDTTDGSVQTIKNYHVLNPGLEFVTYTYIRLSASRYGVELNPSHAYTLKIDVLENGKVTYSGTSASGAFLSTQDDFKTNGTIAHRTYTADTQSPMYGKNALFIGDSITEAICEIKIPTYGVTAGWPGRVSAQNGMNYINAGVSGWSISNIKSQIYKQLQSNLGRPVDYILVGGGANDAWFNAPIGNVTPAGTASSAFDQSTFAGGLEYLFSYAKENFPNAKIGYVMNFKVLGHWYGDTNILGYLDDMTELFNTARKICEKWNVPYLDLYNNDVVSERMQYTTTYAMADYIHPNDKGYDILSPYIDQFMRAVATGKTQAEINALPDPAYDGPAAVITESDVDVAFGKSAVNKDGVSFPTATDGDWKSAKVFGTRNNDPKVSIENQPYLEIDLGWYYDLDKVRVSNYGPNMNLLYQYVIYATDDNTKPLSKWTVLGENKCNIASGEGLIYSFAPTTARYLRLYATGTYGESTYYISSFQAFGKLNPNDPTTDKTPVKVSADKSAVTWDNQSTFKLTDGDKTEEAYATSVGKKSFTVLDLGSVKSVSNVKVLTYEGDSSYGIYGSADGSTWTPIGVKTVESGVSAYETKAGGEYRYIKLLGLRSRVGIGDGYIVIRQIYVQDADGNTIQPVSYTEENIAIGGWTTKNALDGNENDGNYLALGDPVSYITLDLGQVRNLRSVVLFPEDAALPLNVSVSADGETFQSYGKYTGKETYDAAEGYMMAGIASARYIRITPDLSTAPESFGLYEIEASAILEDGDDGTTYNTLVSDKATETTSTGGSSSLLSDGDKTEKSLTIAYTPNGYVMLDLGSSQQISKVIAYTPADDKNSYEILGSDDQKNWTSLGIKELSGDKSYEAAVNAEYRYIKLLHLVGRSNADKYVGVGELEVYAADGTTNLALSATATAFNNATGANSVKDGKGTTSYDGCCWLHPDKPASVTMDLKKITPVNSITVYPKDQESAELLVSTSMDGKNFSEYGKITASDTYDGNGYTLRGGTTARFVKLDYVGASATADLYEVEVRADLTKKELYEHELTATLETPIVSAEGKTLTNANNGNVAGSYTQLPEGENCFMIIDLEKEYELTKICIPMYNANYTYTVYGSNDKTAWTEIAQSTVKDALSITALNGSYRYLKVVGTKCQFSNFTFYEVDVYGMIYPEPDPADLDGDGTVSITDVTALLSYLSDSSNALAEGRDGDLTGDGITNIRDVSRLLRLLAA